MKSYCASATALARAGASAISASSTGSPFKYGPGLLTRPAPKIAATIDDSKNPIATSNRFSCPGGGSRCTFEVGNLLNWPRSFSEGAGLPLLLAPAASATAKRSVHGIQVTCALITSTQAGSPGECASRCATAGSGAWQSAVESTFDPAATAIG